jgi:hypothetical protein
LARFRRGVVAGFGAVIERLHHGNPDHHRVTASVAYHQQQLGSRLPMRQAPLMFRQRRNVISGIAQRLKRLSAQDNDRIEKPLIPRHEITPERPAD